MHLGKVILIYKTNIGSSIHRDELRTLFEPQRGIVEWSVDLEDSDKVLRVVCEGTPRFDVAAEVRLKGFQCEELE